MKNKFYMEIIVIIGCIFVIDQLFIKIFTQNMMVLIILFPILLTYLISYINGKTKNVLEFVMNIFTQKEKAITFILALACVGLYYCICIALNNHDFTDIVYVVLLCYIPWIMLQGDLIELGPNEKG
ncbi:MAG: hypothetical protein LUG12_06820 [Erysipelotrichaceae bacterium]|nr:hypothetical protein [Erysipelotrichaceae bacterium]